MRRHLSLPSRLQEKFYSLLYELEDRHWWFRGRTAVVDALLRRAAPGASPLILDAGCGTGRNLQRYAGIGTAEGVDPSPEAVEFCRRRGLANVTRAGVEALPFENARFDLLMATDVLEHVRDDGGALRELHRVAAPGATLILTVPAYRWLWSDEDERLGHARRYTRRELRTVTAGHGWEPVFGTYFNTMLLLPIALARRLRRSRSKAELSLTPSALDGALSIPMRLEARLIGVGIPLPAGVSIGLVCRRAS
jgi:SAM-dependent methyltransferase